MFKFKKKESILKVEPTKNQSIDAQLKNKENVTFLNKSTNQKVKKLFQARFNISSSLNFF